MTSEDKPWFADPILHHRVTDLFSSLFSSLPTDAPPPLAAPAQDPRAPNTDETRAHWSQADQATRGMTDALFGAEVVEDKAEVRDFTIPAFDGAQIHARLYVAAPAADGERPPLVLTFHGGGMTLTDFNMVFEVNLCHRLAKANVSVLSVDFRNAYVKPFPGGLDDCLAAVNWARNNQNLLGVGECLVTFGSSGGGNLSMATFIRGLQKGCADQIDGIISEAPFIAGQYPAEGLDTHTAYDGYSLTAQGLQDMVNNYTTSNEDFENPAAWPLKVSDEVLAAFPPTLIIVEQCDPLRSDGEALFKRLRQLRVDGCSMIMRYGEIHCQALYFVESDVAELHAEHLAAFVRVQARNKHRRAQ